MKVYVFEKVSGTSHFLEKFEATKKSHIIELMKFKDGKPTKFYNLAEAYSNGEYSYIRDAQNDFPGVEYIMEDAEKAEKQIADIEWIKKVRIEANKYPKNKMHVIEYYRSIREGKTKIANKCKYRILNNYNFEPVII
jgi:hypothetical protein